MRTMTQQAAFDELKQHSDAAFFLVREDEYVVLASFKEGDGQYAYVESSGSSDKARVEEFITTSSREEATRTVIELAGIHVFNGYNPAFHHLPANDDTETLSSLAEKGMVRTSPKAR